ncbi:MAG: hypothetical protein U0573_12320 [Phycisphaerales bacterium]
MGSIRSAIMSGTSWYGLGSTAMRPKLRKGPAEDREATRQGLMEA